MPQRKLFEDLTGHAPFPWQQRLLTGDWPDLLDIPTGLGKTAGVVVAWLAHRRDGDASTGRRLVYCLPMRSLVRQVAASCREWCSSAEPWFQEVGRAAPSVHILMGGEVEEDWELTPESEAILVGTQDMLLSRALCRGFGMSRYRWPVPFGLLSSDCLWVLDETQLMGVGVETSAQLQAFREALGTYGPARTIWMSATLDRRRIETVDHAQRDDGHDVLTLSSADREKSLVRRRIGARKPLRRERSFSLEKEHDPTYAAAVAARAAGLHEERGSLTLVLMNRVSRAQAVFAALEDVGVGADERALVHSRFRGVDRSEQEGLLEAEGSRIVVATQAIEAGIDVSARTMLTELAPFPSLVQRFGRLNRYGEGEDTVATWIDADTAGAASLALPYAPSDLDEARGILEELDDVGPSRLREISYEPPARLRPVLRRKDLVDLFDTTPDLLGFDVDVSRYVRDEEDTDVLLYWRQLEGRPPASDEPAPHREEFCRVSIGMARGFLDRLSSKRRRAKTREDRHSLRAYRWDPLEGTFESPRGRNLRPGDILLLPAAAGGYDPSLGFTGIVGDRAVPAVAGAGGAPNDSADQDQSSQMDRWILLQEHLGHVTQEAERIVEELPVDEGIRRAVVTAASWHDVGKAHAEFQRRLIEPVSEEAGRPPGEGPWAKSDHRRRARTGRPGFRHELASALAWLQFANGEPRRHRDLVAYLVAAHHGKVRISIRSLPTEESPEPDPERPFARGVWDGDPLPAVALPSGETVGPLVLDLSPVGMGEGSWLERTLELRDSEELGPFRLAFLETVVRAADRRASAQEVDDGRS